MNASRGYIVVRTDQCCRKSGALFSAPIVRTIVDQALVILATPVHENLHVFLGWIVHMWGR